MKYDKHFWLLKRYPGVNVIEIHSYLASSSHRSHHRNLRRHHSRLLLRHHQSHRRQLET